MQREVVLPEVQKEKIMLEELKDKLFGYLDWDEDEEKWKWDEDKPKKVSSLEILSFIMDFISAVELEYINEDVFFDHYHTERDSIEREVRT